MSWPHCDNNAAADEFDIPKKWRANDKPTGTVIPTQPSDSDSVLPVAPNESDSEESLPGDEAIATTSDSIVAPSINNSDTSQKAAAFDTTKESNTGLRGIHNSNVNYSVQVSEHDECDDNSSNIASNEQQSVQPDKHSIPEKEPEQQSIPSADPVGLTYVSAPSDAPTVKEPVQKHPDSATEKSKVVSEKKVAMTEQSKPGSSSARADMSHSLSGTDEKQEEHIDNASKTAEMQKTDSGGKLTETRTNEGVSIATDTLNKISDSETSETQNLDSVTMPTETQSSNSVSVLHTDSISKTAEMELENQDLDIFESNTPPPSVNTHVTAECSRAENSATEVLIQEDTSSVAKKADNQERPCSNRSSPIEILDWTIDQNRESGADENCKQNMDNGRKATEMLNSESGNTTEGTGNIHDGVETADTQNTESVCELSGPQNNDGGSVLTEPLNTGGISKISAIVESQDLDVVEIDNPTSSTNTCVSAECSSAEHSAATEEQIQADRNNVVKTDNQDRPSSNRSSPIEILDWTIDKNKECAINLANDGIEVISHKNTNSPTVTEQPILTNAGSEAPATVPPSSSMIESPVLSIQPSTTANDQSEPPSQNENSTKTSKRVTYGKMKKPSASPARTRPRRTGIFSSESESETAPVEPWRSLEHQSESSTETFAKKNKTSHSDSSTEKPAKKSLKRHNAVKQSESSKESINLTQETTSSIAEADILIASTPETTSSIKTEKLSKIKKQKSKTHSEDSKHKQRFQTCAADDNSSTTVRSRRTSVKTNSASATYTSFFSDSDAEANVAPDHSEV